MNTDLYKEKLEPLIKQIVTLLQIERIYLLGAVSAGVFTANIFVNGVNPVLDVREFQLFIICSDNEKRSSEELQELVEIKCGYIMPVTAIVIPAKVFNQWLRKGHTLAQRVCQSNALLFDDAKTEFAKPPDYYIDDMRRRNRREFEAWSSKANEFFMGVDLYQSRTQYNVGAFLLHQAVELAYMAVIRLVTGYRSGTHNLDRMIRYAIPFCGAELNVFPRNNDKERRLFKLLQKAYIHGRYKDDFEILEQDFLILRDRVKKLLVAVQNFRKAEGELI